MSYLREQEKFVYFKNGKSKNYLLVKNEEKYSAFFRI
jgi:hypothetical protein